MIYNNDKLIAAAFIKARAEIGGTVTKDAKGNFGRYATLAAITGATSAALAKHGLAIIQEAIIEAEGVTVDTHLLHESGAVIEFGSLTMPLANRTPQTIGSAITYARKYQWAAVCGLAADDDDGQAAEDGAKQPRKVNQDTGEIVDGDVLFEKPKQPVLSDKELQELNIVGRKFYGDKEWDTVRPTLVQAVSKGAISSATELTPSEAIKLIKGIQKKAAEAAAAAEAAQEPIATVA